MVGALLTGALLLVGGGEQRAVVGPGRAGGQDLDRTDASARLVLRLQRGLRSGDVAGLSTLAAAGPARRELLALARTVQDLEIDRLTLRVVDSSESRLSPSEKRRFGADSWVTDVDLTWRLQGMDQVPSTLEVPLVLAPDGDDAVFVTSRWNDGQRVPLWLLQRTVVRRTRDTMVLATSPGQARVLQGQALTAVRTIRATIPGWDGPLVIEAPATPEQFEAVAGMAPREARAIAAVTTTSDGSAMPRTPVRVFLNPRVFGPLGPEGGQIVLSHEAAHVALGAATTTVPLWLSEGVADYLALADSELGDEVLAAQARRLVRLQGVPSHLPGTEEFDGANTEIGAWYEAAWLAVRLLADAHGESALLRFYRTVERTGGIDAAFREVLGTTEEEFLTDWQQSLRLLARDRA